jgi:TPR repeat protein
MGWLRRGFDQFVQGGKSGGVLSPMSSSSSNDFMRSALCYIHAGELGGYEVSQSNAAYLLQRKLGHHAKQLYLGANLLEGAVPSRQLVPEAMGKRRGSTDPRGTASTSLAVDFADRLVLRELALSTAQGNANSACSVGTLLLSGHSGDSRNSQLAGTGSGSEDSGLAEVQGPGSTASVVMDALDREFSLEKYLPARYLTAAPSSLAAAVSEEERTTSAATASAEKDVLTDRNAKAAMAWFSRASAMGSALGSFHAGLMHHFGIGGVEPNLVRASRYYSAAVVNTASPLHPSLKLMAQVAQWTIEGSGAGTGGEEQGALSWLRSAASGVAGWVAAKMLL